MLIAEKFTSENATVAKEAASSPYEPENNDEQEQITIARALLNYRLKEKMTMANNPKAVPFPKKFPIQPDKRPSMLLQPPLPVGSKILPLFRPMSNPRPRPRPTSPALAEGPSAAPLTPQNFPSAGTPPYVPVRQQYRMPYCGMAPPVTVRSAVPCFSAPPLQQPAGHHLPVGMGPQQMRMASPVRIRQAVPVFAAPSRSPAPPPVVMRLAQTKEQFGPAIGRGETKEQSLPAIVIPLAVKPAVQENVEVTDVKSGLVQEGAKVEDLKPVSVHEGSLVQDAKLAVPQGADAKNARLAAQEKIVNEANDLEESAAAIERLKLLEL